MYAGDLFRGSQNKLHERGGHHMTGYCPYCGKEILSDRSNFCFECGQQLREIPPEDVDMIAPAEDRHKPMEVNETISFLIIEPLE